MGLGFEDAPAEQHATIARSAEGRKNVTVVRFARFAKWSETRILPSEGARLIVNVPGIGGAHAAQVTIRDAVTGESHFLPTSCHVELGWLQTASGDRPIWIPKNLVWKPGEKVKYFYFEVRIDGLGIQLSTPKDHVHERSSVLEVNFSLARWSLATAGFAATKVPAMLAGIHGVPDGTKASIEIRHAVTNAIVPADLGPLSLKDGRIVSPPLDFSPTWPIEDLPWEPWDRPHFYYFIAKVHAPSGTIAIPTPKDYAQERAEVLHIPKLFDLSRDAMARLATGMEINLLSEDVKSDWTGKYSGLARTFDFVGNNATRANWAAQGRSAYVHHHAGHGVLACKVDNRIFMGTIDSDQTVEHRCPVDKNHPAKSAVFLFHEPEGQEKKKGDPIEPKHLLVDADAVRSASTTPHVPHCLVYLSCCYAGKDPSLANAYLSRGTKYVIAFEKPLCETAQDLRRPLDHPYDATLLARRFYQRWRDDHAYDPAAIPAVFSDTFAFLNPAHSCWPSPKLFGGKQPSQADVAGAAIRDEIASSASFLRGGRA